MNSKTISRRELLAVAGASALGAMATSFAAVRGALAASSGSRPNLILFMPDEMRADTLGCYGNPVTKTPNYDRLAQQGARFENCHVQNPVCVPSRCSMLTGWPVSVRGHRSMHYSLRAHEPNMLRYLKNAGYDVFLIGKNDALSEQAFLESVTYWKEKKSWTKGPVTQLTPDAYTFLIPGGEDRRKTSDYELLQLAIKVLERRETDRPFCLFLALQHPHPPYAAPAGFDTLYKPADLPPLPPPDLPKKPAFHRAFRETAGLTRVADTVFRQVRATYYGQVSYSDWLLGELLEAMDRTGRVKDTALVVTSDHGDYAGDYGLVEKWTSGLESCLTNVPLIARVPGGKQGVAIREMVELFDIMPTFLELAGTRATHTHFARSFVPQLHGAAGDASRAAFSEGGFSTNEPQAFNGRLPKGIIYYPRMEVENSQPQTASRVASIKTPQWTYIARPEGQSELYDRSADPQETKNLIDSSTHAHVRNELGQRLMNWYIATTGVPEPDKDPRAMPPEHMPSF